MGSIGRGGQGGGKWRLQWRWWGHGGRKGEDKEGANLDGSEMLNTFEVEALQNLRLPL